MYAVKQLRWFQNFPCRFTEGGVGNDIPFCLLGIARPARVLGRRVVSGNGLHFQRNIQEIVQCGQHRNQRFCSGVAPRTKAAVQRFWDFPNFFPRDTKPMELWTAYLINSRVTSNSPFNAAQVHPVRCSCLYSGERLNSWMKYSVRVLLKAMVAL